MMQYNLTYALVIYAIIGYSLGARYMETKPDFVKTCQRNKPDSEFVPCATESLQILYTKLASGIEGFENLPSIDPNKLKKIRILSGEGPVSLNTTLTKAVVTGFGNTIVIRSNVSPVDFSWETNLLVPKLRIEGNYETQGRVLVLPLVGRGKCFLEPHNMNIVVHTTNALYEKYGHIFYNITKTRIDFNMTGLKLHFYNLFDGIKVLEEGTNNYLNENWREVSEAFKPIIAKTIEDLFMELLNKIFAFIPADYFISDISHPSELYEPENY